MAEKLTEKQREVLSYLDGCEHASRNIMRRVFGRPPTVTLLSLEKRGFVRATYAAAVLSNNVRWTITDAGRVAARAL